MPARMHPEQGMATPMVVHESPTHVVVAVELAKADIYVHRRFLESLLAIARRFESLLTVDREVDGDR
jgi:hypothetical protein